MSGDACSVMGVCSLLLMMCLHERECEYHSIKEGPKLLLSCSSCHARFLQRIPKHGLRRALYDAILMRSRRIRQRYLLRSYITSYGVVRSQRMTFQNG